MSPPGSPSVHGARQRWLLPAGFEETLPPRAARLEACRRRLLDLFSCWGYDLVVTPFIEYLDSLLTGTGQDLDLRTFKLIDQLSGRLMGVRADMTPQVARIDAHHLRDERPARLCYLGTVLHTLPAGFSASRSPVQVGAELFGHAGVESDVEVLSLMLQTLSAAGVREPFLDIGHVGIYRGLAAQAGLDAAQEATLHEAMQRKARDDIDELLADFGVAPPVATMLAALPELNGDEQVLCEARQRLAAADGEVPDALRRLEALAGLMRARHELVPLHFDLAELRGYRYHTGVVFAAFVPGHGQEIARGGRYDHIGRDFGHARPATGFSTDLKTLVALAEADVAMPATGVFAPWCGDGGFERAVRALRAGGERVVYGLPGQQGGARDMGCDRVLVRSAGRWRVQPVDGAIPPARRQESGD